MISQFSVLGLQENASADEIEAAFAQLVSELKSPVFKEGTKGHEQAKKCLQTIDIAHDTLITPDLKAAYQAQRSEFLKGETRGDTRPRIGQLCVASGMISMEQLKEAVEDQVKTGMPLGEVLQEKKFISAAELDGLLLGQEMIDIPSAITESMAVRLIALGLLSEDMGLIAQMEHRSQAIPISDIVTRHGWVDPEILKIMR
jgi:hypothetical protein